MRCELQSQEAVHRRIRSAECADSAGIDSPVPVAQIFKFEVTVYLQAIFGVARQIVMADQILEQRVVVNH